MKIIETITGKEYLVDDEEVKEILQLFKNYRKGMVRLRNGTYINIDRIVSIGDIPKIPTINGYIIRKGDYYIRDGHKIYLENKEDYKAIKMIPDPKYIQVRPKLPPPPPKSL